MRLTTPKFPEVHVQILDLIDDEDPWKVINLCVFAAQRAGVSAGNRLLFIHEALSSDDFATLCLTAIDWWDCD